MPYETPNSTDVWLVRNLRGKESASGTLLLGSSMNGYRLRVFRLMLALSAVAVAVMWYLDESRNLLNAIDHIGYPVLLAVTSIGTVLLLFRPASFQAVVTTVFVTFTTYLLASYYYILIYQGLAAESSSYMLSSIALWLPLSYVAGYVFFSPRVAVRTSLAIYVTICLPQLFTIHATNALAGQLAVAILVSHPVYIAALWGVARLKVHTRGIHALAKSMSMAASVDPLTGIANRRAMLHALDTVSQVLSGANRPVALLLFDVDHFKVINDHFGHAGGDKVLVELAQRANAHLRPTDLIGRWGGEEFIILALDQDGSQALLMAERLRVELEQIAYPDVGTVTVSIGVTSYLAGEDVDNFVNRADKALYLAKERGRNRVEGIFGSTPAMT